jgi:hypothetical protein
MATLLSRGTLADPSALAELIGSLSRALQPEVALALYEVCTGYWNFSAKRIVFPGISLPKECLVLELSCRKNCFAM